MHEVGANETGSACDKASHARCYDQVSFLDGKPKFLLPGILIPES